MDRLVDAVLILVLNFSRIDVICCILSVLSVLVFVSDIVIPVFALSAACTLRGLGHQLHDTPGDQANDDDRDQRGRFEDRFGLGSTGGRFGENTFKDADKELSEIIDPTDKDIACVRTHEFEHESETEQNFNDTE